MIVVYVILSFFFFSSRRRHTRSKRDWSSDVCSSDLGSGGALLGSGTFYSTAAVVYGRVYLGNTDGRVYAYDASSGRLDWAVQTGAYVYASPAEIGRASCRERV